MQPRCTCSWRVIPGGETPPPASPFAARARRVAAPPLHLEHREIPVAAWSPLGSGGDIVTAQMHPLIGLRALLDVRFSNRPFEVKHFQTIHHCSVDVAHGLALLFGIGTKALPSWDPRTRWNNLWVGLAVRLTAGPSGHANSPHPSSREGHHSTARWSSSFLLSGLILPSRHAAATACSRVQRNSVPSTQMRCMITANRRASATIAFFIPRRLAICIAQALSQDHFLERIML